jgi:hypothetical protein
VVPGRAPAVTGDRLARPPRARAAGGRRPGPPPALLRLVHGRRTVDDAGVEVFGDRDLLDRWLGRVAAN